MDYYSPSETFLYINHTSIRSDEGLMLESLYGGQFTLSTQLIKPNYPGRRFIGLQGRVVQTPVNANPGLNLN